MNRSIGAAVAAETDRQMDRARTSHQVYSTRAVERTASCASVMNS